MGFGPRAEGRSFHADVGPAVMGRHAGRPDETTSFPQTMYVDWVRVYQQPEDD